MAVQKKTNKSPDNEEKKPINWMQVCVVGFCILVVAMCIFSFANFQNFFRNDTTVSSLSDIPAVEGYPVIVSYSYMKDDVVMDRGTMIIPAGTTVSSTQYASTADGEVKAMHADEFNAVSTSIIGKKPGEVFTINGPGVINNVSYITKEDATAQGIAYDDIDAGTVLNLGEPYTDENGNEGSATINGVVIEKTDSYIAVQYAPDTIEVNFVGYYQTSA